MDTKDLSELAKTHEEALLAQNLTKSELIALLALIQARIYSKVYSNMGPSIVTVPLVSAPKTESEPPKKSTKSVKYDPVYDPQPPFEPDKPPERIVSVKVLAQPNDACVCMACNKVSYTVNRLIRDGDKVDNFLASYTPMPSVPKLTRKIEIMNVDGQISVDCPQCGANKSLYLTGHPVHG